MVAYLKRGEAKRRRDELEPALKDLRRASELDPTATRPRELLGDVNYAMGRYTRAAEQYQAYSRSTTVAQAALQAWPGGYRAGDAGAAIDALPTHSSWSRFAEATI